MIMNCCARRSGWPIVLLMLGCGGNSDAVPGEFENQVASDAGRPSGFGGHAQRSQESLGGVGARRTSALADPASTGARSSSDVGGSTSITVTDSRPDVPPSSLQSTRATGQGPSLQGVGASPAAINTGDGVISNGGEPQSNSMPEAPGASGSRSDGSAHFGGSSSTAYNRGSSSQLSATLPSALGGMTPAEGSNHATGGVPRSFTNQLGSSTTSNSVAGSILSNGGARNTTQASGGIAGAPKSSATTDATSTSPLGGASFTRTTNSTAGGTTTRGTTSTAAGIAGALQAGSTGGGCPSTPAICLADGVLTLGAVCSSRRSLVVCGIDENSCPSIVAETSCVPPLQCLGSLPGVCACPSEAVCRVLESR